MPYTLHLIANAHLDPVWLWDRGEGWNQALATCRTVLDLMDEDPQLTFTRGEAAVYEHIEKFDPEAFTRIAKYVAAGRWDVVGGTYIQPDTNMPATETFARHFLRGARYFESRFGAAPRVAWAADSFGHSAGLPEILAAAGMDGYAFSRPAPAQMTLEQPAFWWQAASGAKILAYRVPVGWYGAERGEMPGRLDGTLAAAQAGKLENIGVFYGLGDHGGGPTRRQLAEIRQWAENHPGVKVIHSGLHRLLAAVRGEAERGGSDFLETRQGELNFCLRGCYVSAAKVKFPYRRLEAALTCAESADAAVSAALESNPADLSAAWDTVLLNSFHDILPGSSIERALDQQIAQIGGALSSAQDTQFAALTRLAQQIDTQVSKTEGDSPSAVPFLVWNPHSHEFAGLIELEACLDGRPLFSYQGRADQVPLEVRGGDDRARMPFQRITTEGDFGGGTVTWRARVIVPMTLPPLGWNIVTVGIGADDNALASPITANAPGLIENEFYSAAAQAGANGIQITRRGKSLFGDAGLSAITVEDPWGSWGGMAEEPESLDLSEIRETWRVNSVHTLENGPLLSRLWVRLAAGNSRLDLTISLAAGRDCVDIDARLLWNERAARLKLVMPAGELAEFEVPGGTVQRGPMGEVPGGRWVRVSGERGDFGFASDALYGFDCKNGALRASIIRSGRYASERKVTADQDLWRPALDSGEYRFQFLLTTDTSAMPRLARELAQPPAAQLVPASPGPVPRVGSVASLAPANLQMLALKPAESRDGWVIRVQEISGEPAEGHVTWLGQPISLGAIAPHQIVTWKITRSNGAWRAARCDIAERQVGAAPDR